MDHKPNHRDERADRREEQPDQQEDQAPDAAGTARPPVTAEDPHCKEREDSYAENPQTGTESSIHDSILCSVVTQDKLLSSDGPVCLLSDKLATGHS
jgi:hypothetical protein